MVLPGRAGLLGEISGTEVRAEVSLRSPGSLRLGLHDASARFFRSARLYEERWSRLEKVSGHPFGCLPFSVKWPGTVELAGSVGLGSVAALPLKVAGPASPLSAQENSAVSSWTVMLSISPGQEKSTPLRHAWNKNALPTLLPLLLRILDFGPRVPQRDRLVEHRLARL